VERSALVWVVSIAIGTAMSLTACGGHDSADSRASTDPTTLPSATPPSTERAESFVRRFVAAEVRMENTGRTARYLAMSRTCDVCRLFAHNVAHRYAAGGYIRGGGLRIDSIESPPPSQGTLLFTVHGHTAPITIRDSSSRPEKHFAGQRVTYLVGVMPTTRSFSVTSMTSA
jgi:hypothetical protein